MKFFIIVILSIALVCMAGDGVYAEQGFDYNAYLAANSDLPRFWGKADCIKHYIHFGYLEQRAIAFKLDAYLAANPDFPGTWSHAEALTHYNLYGKNECRLLGFSEKEYLSLCGDLPRNLDFNEALRHYLVYGRSEGRYASFDRIRRSTDEKVQEFLESVMEQLDMETSIKPFL